MSNELWDLSLAERIAAWNRSKETVFQGYRLVTHWTELVKWTDDDLTTEQVRAILGPNPPTLRVVAEVHMQRAWNCNDRLAYAACKSVLKNL